MRITWVMGIDERLIDEIVRRVVSVSKPDRIILFGFAAPGQMTRDSEIDLLTAEARRTQRNPLRFLCALCVSAVIMDAV